MKVIQTDTNDDLLIRRGCDSTKFFFLDPDPEGWAKKNSSERLTENRIRTDRTTRKFTDGQNRILPRTEIW